MTCYRCGNTLIITEWSEYVKLRRVFFVPTGGVNRQHRYLMTDGPVTTIPH